MVTRWRRRTRFSLPSKARVYRRALSEKALCQQRVPDYGVVATEDRGALSLEFLPEVGGKYRGTTSTNYSSRHASVANGITVHCTTWSFALSATGDCAG